MISLIEYDVNYRESSMNPEINNTPPTSNETIPQLERSITPIPSEENIVSSQSVSAEQAQSYTPFITTKRLIIVAVLLTILLIILVVLNFFPFKNVINKSSTLPISPSPANISSNNKTDIPDFYVEDDDGIYAGTADNPTLQKIIPNEALYLIHANGMFVESLYQIDQNVLHDYKGTTVIAKSTAEQQYWSSNGKFRLLLITDYSSKPDEKGQLKSSYQLQEIENDQIKNIRE